MRRQQLGDNTMFKIQTRQTDGSWFDYRSKITDPSSVVLFGSEREARLFMPYPSRQGKSWRIVSAA